MGAGRCGRCRRRCGPLARGMTMRTSAGAPGRPARAEVYSGTPTQVKSRGSSGSPRGPGGYVTGRGGRAGTSASSATVQLSQ
jgi:hypothetical protein